MKPQFEVSRHKDNSEWNAYNPEYFLVALSIIFLNSVVTDLQTSLCDHCLHEARLTANFGNVVAGNCMQADRHRRKHMVQVC